jgi:hypothetical protein
MGGDRIKEAMADKLHHDFENLQFKAGECVEDFSMHVSVIANQLWALDDKISNKEVIKKILHFIPDHLEQVAISIETLLGLKSMSIEEATGHLCAVEERKKKPTGGAKEGCLLLTEEEWMVRLKIWEGESSNSSHGGRGRDRGRCGRGHGGGDGKGSRSDSHDDGARHSKAIDTCLAYGKLGHWVKECRSKVAKKTAQANSADEEEGELLVIEMVQISISLPLSVSALASATSP